MPSFYRAFEDRYRGSRELIKERLKVYHRFIAPLQSLYGECAALDLGCGRGEWLELLREHGFQPLGVDLEEGMLEVCHTLGLPTERCDALEKLKALPDESQAIVSGFHIAEHIPFPSLQTLVAEALRVLKPAGLLILETPNAENLVVGTNNFYLDPSHERPIPHLLLGFLTEYTGFARSKLLRLQEAAGFDVATQVSLINVLGGASLDYAIVAQKQGDAAQTGLFDPVFSADYGVGLDKLAQRYEQGLNGRFADLEGRMDKTVALCSSLSQYIARLQGKSATLMDISSQAIAHAEGAGGAVSGAVHGIASHMSIDVDALQRDALAHHLRLQLQEALHSLKHAEVRYQNSELALRDQLARAAKAEGLQAKSQASAEVYLVQLQQVTTELLAAFKEQQKLLAVVEDERRRQARSASLLEVEQARCEALRQQISEQGDTVKALVSERESLEAELHGVLDSAAQAKAVQQQHELEIRRLQGEAQQRLLHVAELENRLAGGERLSETTANQLQELIRHSALLEAELRNSQASLKASLVAAEQLSLQADAHQARIQALLGSTSWRISAPLRGMSLAVRWVLMLPVRLAKTIVRPLVSVLMSFVLVRPSLRHFANRQLRRLPQLHARLRAFAERRAFVAGETAAQPAEVSSAVTDAVDMVFAPVVMPDSPGEASSVALDVPVVREAISADFHDASNKRLVGSFARKAGGDEHSGLMRAHKKTIDDCSE